MTRKRRSIAEDEEEEEKEEVGEELMEKVPDTPGDEEKEEAEEEDPDDEEDKDDNNNDKDPSSKRPRQEEAEQSPPQVPPAAMPRALNPPGQTPGVGIVTQIYVENFMCHRKLRVDLNKHINFIHGQNGSGKSAILAALQICLGANAKRTHRARNLKGLVRTDHNRPPSHAKIRVTLLNQGDDAFRPAVFGDKITVERTIAINSGFNGYKLLDVHGKEKTRARKDLDDMLDYMNIQVENPVAILDQEEAKKFLTGKAQDKYAFFMKACELERLDRTFATIVDKLEATRTAKDRVADGMARQQDQVTELKRKYDELIQVEKLQKGLRASEVKCAWATYQVAHVQLVEAQEKKTDFEKKVAKREEELTQAEELSQKSSTGNDQMTKLAAELTAEAQDQAAQKLELEAELKRSAVPFRQQEQKIKALERQERQARKDSQAAQQHLKSAREEIASNSKESEEARLAQNLARAEEELAAVREEEESLRQRVAVALQKYEEIEPSVREAKRKTTDSKGRYRSTKQRLDELEKSTGDTLAMFGPRVKQVKALVESHRRHFRGPVVGPIGAYLKIEEGKEDFAEIAELSLGGGVLDRFIVTNNEDRVTLQKLRLQARCQSDCGIFMVATNPRFRVPKPATALIETAASVLKVESDLVFNCLVDNAKIDQVALARDRVKSELALIENRDGRKVLKGIIKEVYCLPHGDHWILRNGQQAAFSNEKRLKHTIGTDKSAAIAQFKRDIDQLDVDVQEAQREENRLEGEHTAHQRDWNSLKKSHRRSNDRINTLGDQIDQIKIELENTASSNIDTSELEEEVAQQREILAKIATDVERAKVEQGEHQPVIDELRAKIKEIAQRSDKVLNDLSKTEDEMVKVLQTASQHKDGMAKKRAKLDKYLEIMRMHAEKIEGFQEEDDRSLHTARTLQYRLQTVQNAADEGSDKPVAMSPSPDVGVPSEELEKIEPPEGELKDPKYYLAKIERQKEKIKSVRRRQRLSDEDPAEALSRYLKAQEDFKRKMDDIDDLGETIHRYEQDLRGRRRKWHGYRDYLTKVTSNKFSELLGLNRYAGTLDFKHDEGELNLQVQKNDNNGASTSSDVKGLSGGERSFTTMSLLLALGEQLETPFRVMDEFDVFLDPQVRKLTIKALIHTAKMLDHRQFIFITPQDLSGIDQDPKLKIFKLNPPERNSQVGQSQQTLEFSQA